MRSLLNRTRDDDLLREDFADLVIRSLPHPYTWDERMADPGYVERHRQRRAAGKDPYIRIRFDWPLPNVWLGVSVEDQEWADRRIPALLATPAAVRWISAEPLLGPVNLSLAYVPSPSGMADGPRLDWVVVGGESGRGARRMDPEWARTLEGQCRAGRVPYLFKQTGSVLAREWGLKGKGDDPAEWPEPFPQEYPKVTVDA
jgi:protein gp37